MKASWVTGTLAVVATLASLPLTAPTLARSETPRPGASGQTSQRLQAGDGSAHMSALRVSTSGQGAPTPASASGKSAPRPHPQTSAPSARKPLRGLVIAIDPGHQLGNSRHPRQINRLVNAGGFRKACNTTGTATNSGFPEATFAWYVARSLKRQLVARGATVFLTRKTNSYADWGPCIDARGRRGNHVHADAAISIHGDGAASDVRGFFVIRPSDRRHWTHDIYRSSKRLAHRVKRGLAHAGAPVSNSYGGDGFDVRGDLGTLNWSDVPIVMVELANMRNRSDSRHVRSPLYRREVFARGLRLGVTRFLRR